MKKRIAAIAILLTGFHFSQNGLAAGVTDISDESYIVIPDAQLIGQPLNVFINNKQINGSADAKLLLEFAVHAERKKGASSTLELSNPKIIRKKLWKNPANEEEYLHGTLLIFNFRAEQVKDYFAGGKPGFNLPYYFNPAFSFSPMLCIIDPTLPDSGDGCSGGKYSLTNRKNLVLIGNPHAAFLWDALFIIIIFIMMFAISKSSRIKAFSLIREPNGRLSLSRTQLFLWTVAIGLITLDYALKQFEAPKIPVNLLLLMGASALTTGLGQYSTSKIESGPYTGEIQKARLSHLFIDQKTGVISITRFQMFAWTIIALFLFIYKSLYAGIIWEVPIELVGLTGISQASYAVPKIMEKPEDSSNPTPPEDEDNTVSVNSN